MPRTSRGIFVSTLWSTGRGLNPRIQVLQTCALATSPPVLTAVSWERVRRSLPPLALFRPMLQPQIQLTENSKAHHVDERVGR